MRCNIMEDQRKTSESRLRANKKYDTAHYDKVTVKLPKGIKDRILAGNYTVNGYINKVLAEAMQRDGL